MVKDILKEIFFSAIKAVLPYDTVGNHCSNILSAYIDGKFNNFIVAGFGKAACPMAKAIEDFLMEFITNGIVITKYSHCSRYKLEKLQLFEAGHPIPDENGVKGTIEILNILRGNDANTLVVFLISGGGSALLTAPCKGILLHEKQYLTELLLHAGADIQELNTVRKHVSMVKGGRLAEIAYPAKMISLILSDVIGDKLDVIASGPTSPDQTTYNDALNVLRKYDLIERVPRMILDILQKGNEGLLSETPKQTNRVFERVENIIIGSNKIALEAARDKAKALGFDVLLFSSEITGEAREAGRLLAKKALEIRKSSLSNEKKCLISGGETTVTIKGCGSGGRNMELALSFAQEIEGIEGIMLLSAGTDGTDGPTDAAGAIVNGHTISKARADGLDPDDYLKNNDSYTFFKRIDELFITGPTYTNVMDIQIILIE
ncbi:MAG: glycerate kinase [Nitrospirae bacterium]|nr:glycerate kinase [Nitrospirota bacterium]